MKPVLVLGLLFLLPLSGCAAQLEKEATAKAQAHCAEKGLQFVKTDSEKGDNLLISHAQVSGDCIGPDDPRYVKPK